MDLALSWLSASGIELYSVDDLLGKFGLELGYIYRSRQKYIAQIKNLRRRFKSSNPPYRSSGIKRLTPSWSRLCVLRRQRLTRSVNMKTVTSVIWGHPARWTGRKTSGISWSPGQTWSRYWTRWWRRIVHPISSSSFSRHYLITNSPKELRQMTFVWLTHSVIGNWKSYTSLPREWTIVRSLWNCFCQSIRSNHIAAKSIANWMLNPQPGDFQSPITGHPPQPGKAILC